jgi:hypothetical protein
MAFFDRALARVGIFDRPFRRFVAFAIDHRIGAKGIARQMAVERVAEQLAAATHHDANLVFHARLARQIDLQHPQFAMTQPLELQLAGQAMNPVVQRHFIRSSLKQERDVATFHIRKLNVLQDRGDASRAGDHRSLQSLEHAHCAASVTRPSKSNCREPECGVHLPLRRSKRAR